MCEQSNSIKWQNAAVAINMSVMPLIKVAHQTFLECFLSLSFKKVPPLSPQQESLVY